MHEKEKELIKQLQVFPEVIQNARNSKALPWLLIILMIW